MRQSKHLRGRRPGLATGRPDKDESGPAIVRCSHPAFGHGAFNAALDRLMMQAERAPGRKKRWILSIRQQDPRPFDPARRFRSRLRYRPQLCRIRIFERQLIARLHAAMVFNPSFKSH